MKGRSTCAGLMVVAGLISVSASANHNRVSAQATAQIIGCTDPAISGVARLFERRSANGIKVVDVRLFVEGLPEGRHAVHIHEVASCQPCAAAGGHFDPGPNGNSSPNGNHPFHLGDLINVVVTPAGQGRLRTPTTRFTLSPGPLSLFDSDGSVLMIHANPDTFCPDGPVPGCAGGARVACGIIEHGPPAICGNGVVTRPEQCDDSNTTNGDGCSSTCTVEPPPPPPFSEIQAIFNDSSNGCLNEGCHSSGAGGLNLTSGSSRANLVNVPSNACGKDRVEPTDAANSCLFLKVTGAPGVGSRMPLGLPALDATEIGKIEGWINGGALP